MESSELDARVSAMQAEYERTIAALSQRSSLLAAELTSAMRREKALNEELAALKAKES